MKEIKIEMKRAGVRNYSGLNQQELYDLAGQVGIDISRQTIAL
jgi:DNA-binding XRE family transcriptional regulator